MDTADGASDNYVMHRSALETRRLARQAELYGSATRRLFEEAGLGPGMRVLDVGSGAGDVALLAAELVGPHGSVTGIDVDEGVLGAAEDSVRRLGLSNVTFLRGAVGDVSLPDGHFDAVVGRFILMHLPDPVQTLGRLARAIRPGGVVAFQESDYTNPVIAVPPSAAYARMWTWITEAARRAGVELSMGYKLRPTYLAAGLPEPRLRLEAPVGGAPDWPGYEYLADTLRGFLPRLLAWGIATAEEADVATFAGRLHREIEAQHGALTLPPVIGAWTRTR